MSLSRFLPPVDRAMRTLNRTLFRNTIPVTAARVFNQDQVYLIMEKIMKDMLPFRRFNQRLEYNSKLDRETQLLILRPEVKFDDLSTASDITRDYVRSKILELIPYNLKLEYGDWSYEEIMKAILPEGVDPPDPENLPRIGPIAYLAVPEALQEYRKLIAEVICDKSRDVQTVFGEPEQDGEATKLGFVNELLAGPPNYHVELNHLTNNFTFHFDNTRFDQAYFDTKLSAERERVVESFGLGQGVADVFSGVGSLSIPAAKRGAEVFANEEVEPVYQLLVGNRRENRVKKKLHVKNTSPGKFIQQTVKKLFEKTVDYEPFKISKLGRKIKNEVKGAEKSFPSWISHFIFSDPNQSLQSIVHLRGIYARREKLLEKGGGFWGIGFPLIYLYTYHEAPEDQKKAAGEEILASIGKKLNYRMTQKFLKDVQFVQEGPTKNLYCITFQLPPAVAFGISEEELRQKKVEMVDLEASKRLLKRQDDRVPGQLHVVRDYLPSRDPEYNRLGGAMLQKDKQDILEPRPFSGRPTQPAPMSEALPTDNPEHSFPRVKPPDRTSTPGYTPLASFQPRDSGSMFSKRPQEPYRSEVPGRLLTEAELGREFAKVYKEPQGLPSWKIKVHRKRLKNAFIEKHMKRQVEAARAASGGFYRAQRDGNGAQGRCGFSGDSRSDRGFHSHNSPKQRNSSPPQPLEDFQENWDSPPNSHGPDVSQPPRPIIKFHIAADKTPIGGPIIRWH